MSKIRGTVYISILAIILLTGAFFYGWNHRAVSSATSTGISTSTPATGGSLTATSSPVVDLGSVSDALSIADIIALTNSERSSVADLPPLTENTDLDVAAAAKLKDMFAEQYFAHVSPNGTGPGDLAGLAGYDYVVEGENLAEGNFKNGQDLLDAWMASPGHRANILNTRYLDIGVAVGRGLYDGQEVWMAVQEFGKPLSSCPSVDTGLHDAIVSNQTKVAQLGSDLDAIKKALYAVATGTPSKNAAYNQIADHYNDNVTLYNGVVGRLKAEIASYNQEVEAFNACVNG